MAKEKPSQGTDLISPDKIKKEPEDSSTQPVLALKPSAAGKTVTVLASPSNSSGKTSSGQPKTILLVQTVNSRTGGIQSLLLPQSLRSLSATTSEPSLLASRAKMSTVLTLTSSALKSQPSTVPKMAECLLTTATSTAAKPATLQTSQTMLQGVQSSASQGVQSSASQAQIQAQTDIKSIVKLSSAAPPNPLPRICELTFKSRTIKADGTVCTLKEYLCNFCQFMVASQDEFREHFMTHIFSCNYCSFRAFTRFEVLSHKREKHQGIAEELAGYEGLDSFSDQLNSVVADWKLTETPKAISPLPAISIQVPFVSSPMPVVVTQQSVSSAAAATEITDSDRSSVLIVTPKASILQSGIQTIRTFSTSTPVTAVSSSNVSVAGRLHSVSTVASMTTQIVAVSASAVSSVTPELVAQKMTPTVTTVAVSSPAVLPMSTIKTMASVGKSNDNYFTYKIVHDATGKVQAYECDVCSYRSTKINEIFAHASTHTINDLMKSNSNNVQWECFYCSFTSILQANVVSHVIAKHPNKPIQLKRMVSNNPTQRSAGRSVLFRSPTNLMPDVVVPAKTLSPSIKKEKNQGEAPTISATVGTAAKKTDDAGDGCMWGCYYCSVQSVDRNEIILHLKKDHAQQKLVITRRRITHIPVPQSSKGDSETAETGAETAQNDSETNSGDRISSDVQIGDIDSTDPQHSLLKSRRKQVLPRKVPDDVKSDEAGDPGKAAKPSEPSLPVGKGKRRFQNLSRSKESVDLMELKMPEVGSGKKTRRSREVNFEGSTKRMRLSQERGKTVDLTSDVEDDATIIIDGQEGADDVGMPALEDVSNFIKLKSANRKTAAADTVVPTETCVASDSSSSVANLIVNEVSVDNDKEMPVLHPELSMSQQPPLEIKTRKHPETSAGKQSVEAANKPVDFPDDFIVNDSQLFQYNGATSEASCRRCTFTMSGLNARNHMREHCMSHTGGQLWKCPYCPFKCGRCSMIVKHVRNKHKNRPLNAIQRKIYRRPLDSNPEADSGGTQGTVECIGTRGKPKRPASGLRGPRSVKENHMFEWGSHMYECPFCSRRSVFKGSIRVHMKVAHPSENNEVVLKRLPRPKLVIGGQTFNRKAVLNIVPIESMHLYDSLGTLLLDNGTSLKYDLDIDDDVDDSKTVVERTGLRYQCSHCNFRNLTPQVIKIHILQTHPGESTTILDHRSGCRSHRLFLCSNSDCCFATSKPEALKMHACKMLEKSIAPSGDGPVEKTAAAALEIHGLESQLSPSISVGLRVQNRIQESADGDEVSSAPPSSLTKSVDTLSGESRNESSHLSVNFRKRIKTPEGPIDYNDDGTLKGVDLENGSMILECRYCDYPRTSDPVEIKVHLAAKHPRLQPIAVDVEMKEKGVLAHLFICSIFGCDYSSRYSNVFEHHMNVEHPDVESARSVKKKRAQKRGNSDKFRIQPEVLEGGEQSESLTGELVAQENPGPSDSKSSSDCGNKDPLPMAAIASPAASTFSQPALSPVGTVSSEASNAVGDSPAIGSPDDIQISDSPFPATKDTSKPGRKPRAKGHNFDFPCRYECIQCNFRVGSPEEMKSHLVVKHSENFRNFYCIDRRARELRKRQKVIFCRDSRCGFYCKFDEELENHEKYSCSFAPSVRHHHQKATQERVLQYMDSVMKMGPGAPGIEGEKLYQVGSGSSRAAMLENVNNKMYQCSHCTFITTDLHNIRMHVIAEHASTEGGFAEIKTELGTDGNIVMNVNDRGVNELNKSAMNMNLVCDKNVDRESRSMYDAVDTVKVDDEEKVYTVL